jgi:hypothetical protein
MLALVAASSAAAGLVGVRWLGLRPRAAGRAVWPVVETIGLALTFVAANLVLGFWLVRALPAVTDGFVSVYVLEDPALVFLSVLQGALVRWWLERG